MKLCYCDESATGNDNISVMVGIVVDTFRMKPTKDYWTEKLNKLSAIISVELSELHTAKFYKNQGVWRGVDRETKSKIITKIIDWLCKRNHKLVFSVIHKSKYQDKKDQGKIPCEIDNIWKAMGFHIILSLQKEFQKEKSNKGNTLFIFDNKKTEEDHFTKLILNPPDWSDNYYNRKSGQDRLDQIIDVPYFADSKNVGLIQVADFISYLIRRYVELEGGMDRERYRDEKKSINKWIKKLRTIFINYPSMYLKKGRSDTAKIFCNIAPDSIINL